MAGIRVLPVVPGGPRAFRYRIRRLGPVAALFPAAVLGVVAFALLRHNTATTRGVAGFAATVLAAPTTMAFGVPLATGSGKIVLGVLTSAVLWLVLGFVAARRATRSPVASWRDFWREYLWLAAGVWVGVVAALVVVEQSIGRALL
ncbi:MAG: hypothetical protein JWM34_4844 [Ilumatobacteraceae bacterium]|nr:hypothetical protein [Ilumatobacteraceae bacterium]